MNLKTFLSLFFLLIMIQVQGQTKPVTGDWILTLIKTAQKTDQPFIINRFEADSSVTIYGTKIATWTQKNKTIDFKSERFKIYNGSFDILKQTSGQLVLKGSKATLYFKRAYDPKQNNPVYQNLIGTWLMHGTTPTYVRFENDGQFIMLNAEENTEVITKGNWLFLPDDKAFVILADVDILRRKNTILQINKDYMEVMNNGIQYQLEKQPEVLAVKHLQMKEERLTEPTKGQPGLPWTDDDIWIFLAKLKNLHYKYSVYHPDVKVFSENDISVDIVLNPEKQSIKFVSYKEINEERVPFITRTKGPLMESCNRFFPQKDLDSYSVIDKKRPWKLGDKTYECTIVNGVIGDEQYQYWMINRMPGVFAKVIYEKPNDDDKPAYIKYELDSIKMN